MVEKEDVPSRLDQCRTSGNRTGRIGYVFEHFHAGNDIVAAGFLGGECFGGDLAVVNRAPAFEQMQTRHTERFVGEINPGHRRSPVAHAFGEQTATATDVKHPLAGERAEAVDPVKAQWVDVVQWLEVAAGIPPAMRKLAEFLEFALVRIDHDVWVIRKMDWHISCVPSCHTQKNPAEAGFFCTRYLDYLVPMSSISTRRSGCRHSMTFLLFAPGH
jgi:hypothetical protein